MLLVLGDQLTRIPFERDERVLMVEASGFARRYEYHPKKLTLVFSAMRHYRDELRADGVDVRYEQADTFKEGFERGIEDGEPVRVQRPAAHADALREALEDAGATVEFVPNPKFLVSPDDFDIWEEGRDGFRHETFYRHVRRETGYLVNEDGEPVGCDWNYDDENRDFPPDGYETPEPPSFEPDETTRETAQYIEDEYETWGESDGFDLPVTRDEALETLDDFVDERLAEFGPYQDAMFRDDATVNHSLLSSSINLGLLHPDEVAERAVEAYHEGDAPLNSVEGFVRQVVGWREYMRHVYRRHGDELHDTNTLDATRPLPSLYYDAETGMECLRTVVERVWRDGYSHHIERLMVLANFALLYGANPHELDDWFRLAYTDAYTWVTTPNVVGMGSYATDAVSTKPYASSGSYIDRMSDFCGACAYDVDETTGEDACPFNSLYWDFLDENRDELGDNHRMSLMYGHLDRKDDDEMDEIRERADEIREKAREGEL
ncbi:MAG: cryptochrome/photolyase family protein [Halobacteriales archaeon]|nr:cryptochrome/photolyase family protein [Halobacteriales archaeon]